MEEDRLETSVPSTGLARVSGPPLPSERDRRRVQLCEGPPTWGVRSRRVSSTSWFSNGHGGRGRRPRRSSVRRRAGDLGPRTPDFDPRTTGDRRALPCRWSWGWVE